MAEQFLNRPQVGAALQQMCGEGMPQGVGADAEPRAARRDMAPHEPVDAAYGEPTAAKVDEQRLVPLQPASAASGHHESVPTPQRFPVP